MHSYELKFLAQITTLFAVAGGVLLPVVCLAAVGLSKLAPTEGPEWEPSSPRVVYVAPGSNARVVYKREAVLAGNYRNCELESVSAPDWIKASGYMDYYVWQGGTGPHDDVDFRGTVEVAQSAPLNTRAQVLFKFTNPSHEVEFTVTTSPISVESWKRWISRLALWGAALGAAIGLVFSVKEMRKPWGGLTI